MLYSPVGRDEPQSGKRPQHAIDHANGFYDRDEQQQPRRLDSDARAPSPEDSWPLHAQSAPNGQLDIDREIQNGRGNSINIIWPALAVVVPMTLFTAVTLGLVYGYRVNPKDAGNDLERSINATGLEWGNIYVNFSATRLVFVTSWSSSFAPVLIGFLMALWQAPLALQILQASQRGDIASLATPYQLSLIISMATGSISQLFSYFRYAVSQRKARSPPILTRTALVMSLAGVLSLAVFAADTALHYTTKTVPYKELTPYSVPTKSFGRGISDECLHFDRVQNNGFPCPYYFNYSDQGNAAFRHPSTLTALRFNDSGVDQIVPYSDPVLPYEDLLVLLPSAGSQSIQLGYSASTIGVGTKCTPLTTGCNMRLGDGKSSSYFQFNCTDDFWGTLGGNGNLDQSWVVDDQDTPPFSVKDPGGSIQFGYYTDPELEKPYNTFGINPEENRFWYFDEDKYIKDEDLINTVHFAVAGALSYGNSTAADRLISDSTFKHYESSVLFALNCSYATYNVNYQWSNGSIRYANFEHMSNGSVSEFFHGVANQFSEDFLRGATLGSLKNTSADFARAFANGHSTMALSVIGSVMSEKKNTAEVRWENVLVAKVSQASLWSLVAANMLFALLGVVLAVRAYMVSSAAGVVDVAVRVSTGGMTAAALEDRLKEADEEERQIDRVEDLFEERRVGVGTRRVGAVRQSRGGWDLVAISR